MLFRSVNTNNGHYAVGDYMPYRQIVDDLVVGNQYCFGFSWDVAQDTLPAIDYLATFTEDLDLADPTFQTIHDGNLATPDDRIAIPDDPVIVYGYYTVTANIFTGALPPTREIVAWGATFDSVGPYGWVNVIGDPPGPTNISLLANEPNSLEYCLTATASQAVLAWSGHLAMPQEWGAATRPGGNPYHMASGTSQSQWTRPSRISMTDLAGMDALGNIFSANQDRGEVVMRPGDVPTAIQLREIAVNQQLNMVIWVAAFLGFTLMTALFVFRHCRTEAKATLP